MNVLVFGATGRTGHAVVTRAAHNGHSVTAFVRDAARLGIRHPKVVTVQGDALNADSVANPMPGHDFVISCLKIPSSSGRVAAIENILAGMKASGIRRILAVGGSGCLQIDENTRYHESAGFPERFKETSLAHWEVCRKLEASNLDWTFVCPPDIVEGDETEGYITQETYRPEGKRITTAALAEFMLREAERNAFVGKRVGICFPLSRTPSS